MVKQIVNAALEVHDVDERARLISRFTADDPGLADEVQSLLFWIDLTGDVPSNR